MGSEVNTYFASHPADLGNYLSLVGETYAAVKKVNPAVIVTASFQFEELVKMVSAGTTEWTMVTKLAPKLDAVAITTYPSILFNSPSDLPTDYYTRLRNYTTKPVIIAESGWPSGGNRGSPQNQITFLDRLIFLTKDLKPQLLIWWFPHDWSEGGYPEAFATMGLRTSGGVPKPAWDKWLSIYKRPRR